MNSLIVTSAADDRSIVCSVDQSVNRLVGRSAALSVALSVGRSVCRSACLTDGQWIYRSIGRSVSRLLGRRVGRSVWRPFSQPIGGQWGRPPRQSVLYGLSEKCRSVAYSVDRSHADTGSVLTTATENIAVNAAARLSAHHRLFKETKLDRRQLQ